MTSSQKKGDYSLDLSLARGYRDQWILDKSKAEEKIRREVKAQLERRHNDAMYYIKAALKAGCTKGEAALTLGVSRPTLDRYLHEYEWGDRK